ncbi:MAG: hypothetical protein U1E60_17205 [Reyranellaceae bacterium]
MTAGPVSEAEVREMVARWGALHDLQAGLSAFIPFIAATGFYMEFGGKRWEGYEDFETHQINKRRFFDETHETVEIRITPGPDVTRAWTLSHWNARYRPDNSPRSRLIKTVLEHDWEFRRDPTTGRAFMQGHKVTRFEYLPGFGHDDQQAYDPHFDPNVAGRVS